MKNLTLYFSCFLLVLLRPGALIAQVPGISEFYQASAEVRQQFFSFSDLAMVIGAISGLLGGLRVYANWQGGRHHIDRQVVGWLLSCIFLSICSVFLRGLFGL